MANELTQIELPDGNPDSDNLCAHAGESRESSAEQLSSDENLLRVSLPLPAFKDQTRSVDRGSQNKRHHQKPMPIVSAQLIGDAAPSTGDTNPDDTSPPIVSAQLIGDAAPSTGDTNPDDTSPVGPGLTTGMFRIRRGYLICILGVLIVLALVLGGVCGSGLCSPSSSPSNPEPPAPQTRLEVITAYVDNIAVSPEDTSEAKSLAVQWLASDDPLQLNIDSAVDRFRIRQRYALLTLWFQSPADPWKSSTNWLGSFECSWYGITCDRLDLGGAIGQQFVVTEIRLDSNNVHGQIPADLALLTHLRHFNAFNNALVGTIPWHLGQLTALEIFSVGGSNSLTGTLPPSIGNWSKLTFFAVWDNYLTGQLPSSLGRWTDIEIFSAGTNDVNGTLPEEIGQWTSLTIFYIDRNQYSGTIPASVGNWSRLKRATFRNNNFRGSIPSTIANWKDIEWARFYNNYFVGSMPNGICPFITGDDILEADCEL